METGLATLFRLYYGYEPEECTRIAGSASNRRYYRLAGRGKSVVGVSGDDVRENRAFIAIGRHLLEKGLNVPRIYSVSDDGRHYIQQDLGSVSLYDAVSGGRARAAEGVASLSGAAEDSYSDRERSLLIQAVEALPEVQVRGAEGFDFSRCCPVPEFDSRSVMFDLHYFKYCFLKMTGVEFDEMRLEDDFETLRDRLLAVGGNEFMYRDFQARNIMLYDGRPYFIDFQGARRGPVHYDLASFVWQARSAYPSGLKSELISAYIEALGRYRKVDRDLFIEDLRQFVLFRLLQVLGAYGFRGLYEKKRHFMESIPYAMANIREFLSLPSDVCPYLSSLLQKLSDPACSWSRFIREDSGTLTVEVTSFSYRKGIPDDRSGNGGGYVFDCRALENPGRYERYRSLTGMDAEVIGFIEEDGGVFPFLDNVYALVDPHIRYFLHRGFTHLSVCFGCTGGQHRSVYCAESLAKHVVSSFGNAVRVVLVHREQNIVSYPGRDKEDR